MKERNNEEYGPTSDGNIIKFLKETMKSGFDVNEIEQAITIIEKFSMPLDGGNRGIYEELPNIAHSCSPNTYYTTHANRDIVFRAAIAIKNGTVVTYCKTDIVKCNLFRRRMLKKFLISCECER